MSIERMDREQIEEFLGFIGPDAADSDPSRRQGGAIRLCMIMGRAGLVPDFEARGHRYLGNHPEGDFTEAEIAELWRIGQAAIAKSPKHPSAQDSQDW